MVLFPASVSSLRCTGQYYFAECVGTLKIPSPLSLCSPLFLVPSPSKLQILWPSQTPSSTSLLRQATSGYMGSFYAWSTVLKTSQDIKQGLILGFTSFVFHLSGITLHCYDVQYLENCCLQVRDKSVFITPSRLEAEVFLSLLLKCTEIILLFQWQCVSVLSACLFQVI